MDLPPEAVPATQWKPTETPTASALPPEATPQSDYLENYYSEEGMASRAYERNKVYAKPGPYQTELNPAEEQKFKNWIKANPNLPKFDATEKNPDYDMRGFYKALKKGDPRALASVDPYDKRVHLPDVWKTPYHQSFSNESVYATPDAPRWVHGHTLIDKTGKIITEDAPIGPPTSKEAHPNRKPGEMKIEEPQAELPVKE